MKAFNEVISTVCPLDVPNVDTDQIIPKQFLKRVERTGFGQFLFFDWRFKADGSPNDEFSLNKPFAKDAKILLARDNFGCGSSREHAPWALMDYGFETIIAPSYADIFYNNCFQNGILPIILPAEKLNNLFALIEKNADMKLKISLVDRKIMYTAEGVQKEIAFQLDDERQNKLLKGLDDIAWTLQFDAAISKYEKNTDIY